MNNLAPGKHGDVNCTQKGQGNERSWTEDPQHRNITSCHSSKACTSPASLMKHQQSVISVWLAGAVTEQSDGAAVSIKSDQLGSHNILQVTAVPDSSLENNAVCHRQANRYMAAWLGYDSTTFSKWSILARSHYFVQLYAEVHWPSLLLVTEKPYFSSDDMLQWWPYATLWERQTI